MNKTGPTLEKVMAKPSVQNLIHFIYTTELNNKNKHSILEDVSCSEGFQSNLEMFFFQSVSYW